MTVSDERNRSLRADAARRHAGLSDAERKEVYAHLAGQLAAQHRAPEPDARAIDATMRELDSVQAALKAVHARPDDTAQF